MWVCIGDIFTHIHIDTLKMVSEEAITRSSRVLLSILAIAIDVGKLPDPYVTCERKELLPDPRKIIVVLL